MKKENMKEEAIARLETLHVLEQVILNFKHGQLMYSERVNDQLNAVLYFVEDEMLKEKIEEFETNYESLVYHVQLTHTELGDMYTMLYVSPNEEEWESDRARLKRGFPRANVWIEDCFGIVPVTIAPSQGGVVRIE